LAFDTVGIGIVQMLDGLIENDDDFMGRIMWHYGWGPNVWFGAHPSVASEQNRPGTENNRIGYDVNFRLKK